MIMNYKLLRRLCFLVLLLLPGLLNITPIQAGEPDNTVGPANPAMFWCVDRNNSNVIINLDSDAISSATSDSATLDPEAEVDFEQMKRDCEKAGGRLEPIRLTRIEGYVFEFHPDLNGPGGWTAVRSRDVPVVATGPGFQVEWGSEKDGFYYLDNFGAGPITLNLRLPINAHPINPNITVVSTGLGEIWEIDLGFYRGNTPPEDINELRLPADHERNTLLSPDTRVGIDENGAVSEMPEVGGVLPLDQPTSTIALAVVVLIILPAAGMLKLRRRRRD
jgi:hypothetical protein